ncbi:hypothetical protein [Marinimicrobium alkaliphilum]|uniref:hypothetical protein n=1 Tax=Marinimicrobium alkaliphilum TaxID=2202654 RepID=UPI0013005AB9|nr:hypothetical protein [Marinimicrobium alkaliphilum]
MFTMSWLKIPRLKRALPLIALVGLGSAQAQLGVDLDKLTVPQTYVRYLPPMVDAARLVKADETCVTLIAGEVHTDRSTPEHPIFRFSCRDDDRRLFSWLVDGLSLKLLDESRPEGQISFADLAAERERERARDLAREQERAKVREQLQALQDALGQMDEEDLEAALARRIQVWRACRSALIERAQTLAEVHWLTETMPEPEMVGDGVMRFEVDFNARDPRRQLLEYRASCVGSTAADTELRLRPRVEAVQPAD